MTDFGAKKIRDETVLIARILLAMLFLTSGWGKVTGFSVTVAAMAQIGVPLPPIATAIAIVIECLGSIALILGIWIRPWAALLAAFTLAATFLAHHFWTMEGAERYANSLHFYKNVSIIGGFFLLYVTGAGKYSVDARRELQDESTPP